MFIDGFQKDKIRSEMNFGELQFGGECTSVGITVHLFGKLHL